MRTPTPPTVPKKKRAIGPLFSFRDFCKRVSVWFTLFFEYPAILSVYKRHRADGFFDFGVKPLRFNQLAEHDATARLLAMRRLLPGGAAFGSTLRFKADGAVLPTYLPVEEGASAALGALSLAAADLYELRTGRAQEVEVRQTAAGLMTASYLYFYAQPSGEWGGCHGFDQTMAAEGTVKPQRKAYECKDGRHIFLHGGFPKLKKGLTDFLQCECTVAQMSEKVAQWTADDLEKAMQAKGLCATKCRTPMEWRESAQGQQVLKLKELEFKPHGGSGGERALPSKAARPLSDVIVIDFSHVIASPVVGRTLADHGATVIKVVSHSRPRRELFDAETNHGKNVLTVELDTAEGRERLWDLLKVADVVIDGYSKGVLARFGFSIERVLARNSHLIYLKSSCFGHVGPLAHGKGFQQNANFATGVASIEDEALLGYQLVSQIDYATGYIGAYGVILGLIDRQLAATEGRVFGGMVVYASLCQTATWMMRLGAGCPNFFDYLCRITKLLWFSDRKAVDIDGLRYIPLQAAVAMSVTAPQRHGFERWWQDDAPTEDLVPVKSKSA